MNYDIKRNVTQIQNKYSLTIISFNAIDKKYRNWKCSVFFKFFRKILKKYKFLNNKRTADQGDSGLGLGNKQNSQFIKENRCHDFAFLFERNNNKCIYKETSHFFSK